MKIKIEFTTPRGAHVTLAVNADLDRHDVVVVAGDNAHQITTRHVGLGKSNGIDCLLTGGALPGIGLDEKSKAAVADYLNQFHARCA